MITALITGVVLIMFIVFWNLWLEKLFFKSLDKLDEWKNGETVEIIIDPHSSGPDIRRTIKDGKMKYLESEKSGTKEKYYKTAGLYIESAIKGKDLSLSK